ncbi:hypothetical protein BJV78DRAFT_944175 [Lactifluus subvellereus]|nr:hypothetical protein BJV78DRAFT_944175 [Lactifluus subvellereus]
MALAPTARDHVHRHDMHWQKNIKKAQVFTGSLYSYVSASPPAGSADLVTQYARRCPGPRNSMFFLHCGATLSRAQDLDVRYRPMVSLGHTRRLRCCSRSYASTDIYHNTQARWNREGGRRSHDEEVTGQVVHIADHVRRVTLVEPMDESLGAQPLSPTSVLDFRINLLG